ncbi:pyrroline-5-carboxylate reductase [Venenivibrio stagnispumantis]|uniref:Pyrroline-5-carboxylate reductase n=1 Tax=Venenivibrio stagnispumantis TaxID=407998 RepID=A0AA45WN59_9AQUI|nr:pyrroline-5-carboxylate reductase [Venenivibrio stagnispumantis]MCW4573581.1 pyrroline-5-carboxylate reductase [Venenivibrio stagnispumantis]SMP16712.1 pyrroline-5-carboxylate reductase [Venenivibrio stagnispumantis]
MFRVGIIGTGNMGEALIKGIIEKTDIKSTQIIAYDINKEKLDSIVDKYNIAGASDSKKVVKLSEYIILAVKPKDLKETLQPLKDLFNEDKVIISILAGVKIAKIKEILAKNIPVVRIMPNTPALIGEGTIGISFDDIIKDDKKLFITELFSIMGEVFIKDENYMDIITGLAGSGPAYVYIFIDALAQGGVKMGLSYEEALQMAIQTVIGSAKLLKETGLHPMVARDKVTSPAGTTIYGIATLEEEGFRNAVIKAVENATKRSKELSD